MYSFETQKPIQHKNLVDSNLIGNQIVYFKSALMNNLSQREEVKNNRVDELITLFL